MSSTEFSFKVKLKIGETVVPLASEIVLGDADAQNGVQKGFLFKLDLQPGETPPAVNLGAIIDFIEQKLGVGANNLGQAPGIGTIKQAFPPSVGGAFNSGSNVVVVFQSFVVNSTTDKFLFSISVDVESTDPTKGLIPLPAEMAKWLNIQNLAISFTTETAQQQPAQALTTKLVDLKVGLNLTVGSVPVSLAADIDKQADKTIYTFNGCVQDADIPLGEFLTFVGQQFGVDVQLPPELNLSAKIDYIAGQVIQTTPNSGNATTDLGVSAKFDLSIEGRVITLRFYADTIITSPAPSAGNPYVVGASIDVDLAFASLPLVGNVPDFSAYTLNNVGFSYTNVDASPKPVQFSIPQVSSDPNPLYTRSDSAAKNSKTYTISGQGGQNFTLQNKGFSLTAALSKAGETVNNFALPMKLPQATARASQPATFYPNPTSPPGDAVHWININKNLGPVNLQKIGLNYSGGEATFGFSAGFAVAGFSLDLQGLTITFPIPGQESAGVTSFNLDGLGFNLSRGGLKLGGAFLKVLDNGVASYYGEIMAQMASFGFKALGGYTPAGDGRPASFFLYANIDVPLGGPPFLFVTGLAGGFGINRTLILPTMDTLSGYILLPNNAPAEAGSPSDTIAAVLPQLQSVFQDEPGEYWLAAGIQFTSFEMIDAFALVTVSFGVDLQVGLLGSCAMTFPKGDPAPIAYVEIDLIASVTPSTGLFSVMGKLSPASYVYGGFCHISGGFAFDIWFSGEHKDDFVVSVGGYSPFLQNVAPYPAVPRLTLAYGLGPFQVTGQAYFALTPAMMMAGMSMSAVWSSGPIKAWLDVGVDILLSWAPFHYEADAYAAIGCSVDLGLFTLDVHIGADLYVWGPPFGGTAHVDLDVVSFDINFGADRTQPPAVGWATFKQNFLPQNTSAAPAPQARAMMMSAPRRRKGRASAAPLAEAPPPEKVNIISASVTSGLARTKLAGFDWVIDPDDFAILTNSTIPANNGEWQLPADKAGVIPNAVASYNPEQIDVSNGPYLSWPPNTRTFSADQVWNPTVNIGPMKQNNVQSYHTVQVLDLDTNQDITSFSCTPILANSNTAMWGQNTDQKNPNDSKFLPSTLVGFLLTPIPRRPDQTNSVDLVDLLYEQGNQTQFANQARAVNTAYPVQSAINPPQTLTITISGAHSQQIGNQNYVLGALADSWVSAQRATILSDLVAQQFSTLSPDQVNVSLLATTTALMDWPTVELLAA